MFNRHSDRVEERCWHIITPLLVGIAGFLLAISTMNTMARYISLYVLCLRGGGHVKLLNQVHDDAKLRWIYLFTCVGQRDDIQSAIQTSRGPRHYQLWFHDWKYHGVVSCFCNLHRLANVVTICSGISGRHRGDRIIRARTVSAYRHVLYALECALLFGNI